MIGIVDRIEGNIVVIEVEEKMYNIDIVYIEGTLQEGDTVELIFEDDVLVKVVKKVEETESRKEYMENLLKDMWQ